MWLIVQLYLENANIINNWWKFKLSSVISFLLCQKNKINFFKLINLIIEVLFKWNTNNIILILWNRYTEEIKYKLVIHNYFFYSKYCGIMLSFIAIHTKKKKLYQQSACLMNMDSTVVGDNCLI